MWSDYTAIWLGPRLEIIIWCVSNLFCLACNHSSLLLSHWTFFSAFIRNPLIQRILSSLCWTWLFFPLQASQPNCSSCWSPGQCWKPRVCFWSGSGCVLTLRLSLEHVFALYLGLCLSQLYWTVHSIKATRLLILYAVHLGWSGCRPKFLFQT